MESTRLTGLKRPARRKAILFSLLLLGLLLGSVRPGRAQLTRDENLSRFDDKPLHFGFYMGINT
ncbi:MAG: hypothetical protein LWW85_10905, partial [Marinilabiliales bacterium]|nr:hypothetical protein [Marinilabiliales bacterium]